MSSKFSSAFVVTMLLSHTVLAPLTAVAQEQDASPQQVQGTTDSNLNESVETAQRAAEPIDAWMPDKALQAAVAQKLGKNVSQITKTDMSGLTSLLANDAGIANLAGLQYASKLSWLYLDNNHITDLTPLKDLSNLSYLGLDNNQVSDLTPLQHLSNLSRLDLDHNQVSDLTLLQHLLKLSELNLDNNHITDLTPLQHLSKLQNLGLYYNHITDLTPLKDLSNLSTLYLGVNQISDLTPLQHLSNLSILYLQDNHITDLTPLKDLSNLSTLCLDSNHITDLTPLQNINLVFLEALEQTIILPPIYVLNKQPYSTSVQTAIKGLAQGTLTISPQNNGSWIGNYSGADGSGKMEWSSANPVPEQGELVLTWGADYGGLNFQFSGKYVQPYTLSKEKPTNPDPSKGEVTPEGKPSTPEPSKPDASKGKAQSKKEKASKKLPATGEKDTKIFSAIGLGILAILGTYISRKKRSDS